MVVLPSPRRCLRHATRGGAHHDLQDSIVTFVEKVEEWVPADVERIYAIFQPKYAAYLNPIEPWWKALRFLAIRGRFFETREQVEEAISRAVDYRNAHRRPYAWCRRRRHRTVQRPDAGAMSTMPEVGG